MQVTNSTHANVLTPVCLEKWDRDPPRRLTIDAHKGQHYVHAVLNAREDEVEELPSPEKQVPFGLGGIGHQLPTHRRATKRGLVHFIKRL